MIGTLVFFGTGLALSVATIRGGPFHTHLVRQTSGIFRKAGFDAREEFPVALPGGGLNFTDILVTRGGFKLAVEIETTPRHALTNARKALQCGLPLCVIVPTKAVRRAIVARLTRQLPPPVWTRNWIFMLDQLPQALTQLNALFSQGVSPWEFGKTNRLDELSQRR